MVFVDVHAHLQDKRFKDISSVIGRAAENGIGIIISNGLDKESNLEVLELSKKFTAVKSALGLYPLEALKLPEKELNAQLAFIKKNKNKIVAIGEVGMDYLHSDEKEKQKEIFSRIIKLALEISKPLIVHSRRAEEDTIRLLEENKASKVVMHCFTGSMKLVKRIEKNRWFLSIPCTVVRDEHFQKIVEEVSLNHLLTESDAPYLSPVQGQINEPANIAKSIEKIAEIKGMVKEEAENNIFLNYRRLFE